MRSTFALILVSLLLAFYAILGITFFFMPPKVIGTPEDSGEALKTALLNEAFLEHGLYLRDSCKSHEMMERAGTLIKLARPDGGDFSLLCGGTVSPAFSAVLHKAMSTHELASGPDGAYWVIAYPFLTPDGHPLVIAQYSLQAGTHSLPWAKMFVPLVVCGMVSLLLAFFFSAPVRELRSVVRSFAAGRMDARVPEPRLRFGAAGTTEIRSLMIDFNRMADRIAALMEAQKLLLRDVSHELRSPLARLSVALELARDQAPASVEVQLQRIEDEANQLNRLIGELLSLSSLESLHNPIAAVPVSLINLIEMHLPNLQFEASARGCDISLNAVADPTVVVDPELMGRAIENIVRNAIRYSRAGDSVELEVTRQIDQCASSAVLHIMDRGPGVPENMRDAIFRPFVRVDASRNGSTGGFGVGLAIAERAVHLHGGEIRALPREGSGLIVEIRLPAQENADSE
ncbi:MAG: ATP-binding protein [Terracidiphilus sp.]|nr:ATP-binding protein [Terracidiphilus sp.]